MELLTAVNLMLPKLGEHPVTSLTAKHPTLAVILPEIDNTLRLILSKGWWFNTYTYTAMPDNEGNITLGQNTLSFVPGNSMPNAALRGLRLFNPDTIDYVWTQSVTGVVVQTMDFQDVPEAVAQYVMYAALVSASIADLGMTDDVRAWQSLAGEAAAAVLAEHLRHKKYSTTKSRRFQRLRCAMRS